jgi:predicted transposase/invertase (TIGR01784 family)
LKFTGTAEMPNAINTERKEIERVLAELAYDKLSDNEKALIQKEQDDYAKRESELWTAKRDGMEQGLTEGAMRAKRENALAMLKANLDHESIAKFSGLSLEEVHILAKK